LLPAILLGGLVALRTTTKTFQARGFELFLEFDLVSHFKNFDSIEKKLTGLSGKLPRMNRYPGRNSVLICNNAQIHRGKRVKELCCQSGVHLMFLLPYCPELNLIELGFGAIKTSLQSLQVLSRDTNPQWETQKSAANIFNA
jgi:hypothetical protein